MGKKMLSVSVEWAVTPRRLLGLVAGTLAAVPPRPHQLSMSWRTVVAVGWVGISLCVAAVWNSSRTMGLSTWWLGPDADPQPLVVQVLPFVLPILLVVGAVRNIRYLPWLGFLAAATLAGVGLGDLAPYGRYGVIELALAAAGALLSLASIAGYQRGVRSEPTN
jgi:hypothetical protein